MLCIYSALHGGAQLGVCVFVYTSVVTSVRQALTHSAVHTTLHPYCSHVFVSLTLCERAGGEGALCVRDKICYNELFHTRVSHARRWRRAPSKYTAFCGAHHGDDEMDAYIFTVSGECACVSRQPPPRMTKCKYTWALVQSLLPTEPTHMRHQQQWAGERERPLGIADDAFYANAAPTAFAYFQSSVSVAKKEMCARFSCVHVWTILRMCADHLTVTNNKFEQHILRVNMWICCPRIYQTCANYTVWEWCIHIYLWDFTPACQRRQAESASSTSNNMNISINDSQLSVQNCASQNGLCTLGVGCSSLWPQNLN